MRTEEVIDKVFQHLTQGEGLNAQELRKIKEVAGKKKASCFRLYPVMERSGQDTCFFLCRGILTDKNVIIALGKPTGAASLTSIKKGIAVGFIKKSSTRYRNLGYPSHFDLEEAVTWIPYGLFSKNGLLVYHQGWADKNLNKVKKQVISNWWMLQDGLNFRNDIAVSSEGDRVNLEVALSPEEIKKRGLIPIPKEPVIYAKGIACKCVRTILSDIDNNTNGA